MVDTFYANLKYYHYGRFGKSKKKHAILGFFLSLSRSLRPHVVSLPERTAHTWISSKGSPPRAPALDGPQPRSSQLHSHPYVLRYAKSREDCMESGGLRIGSEGGQMRSSCEITRAAPRAACRQWRARASQNNPCILIIFMTCKICSRHPTRRPCPTRRHPTRRPCPSGYVDF